MQDSQNEMRIELGDKALKCKFCSWEDMTDSKADVSTIEVSNKALKSLTRKSVMICLTLGMGRVSMLRMTI